MRRDGGTSVGGTSVGAPSVGEVYISHPHGETVGFGLRLALSLSPAG
jgi:hypothetical protein